MENYAIYLRKSRADAEAEARGEGETLTRHEHALLDLAKRQDLSVVQIYREIVSGDSIAARPQMQQLLQDITAGCYAGVLVMEIERLARGDTIDQGVVAQAFRDSDTKIITPIKTYDPNNEFDEEYFEFSLFMSRREYKTIKRRMQAGRVASVKEGNYIGTNPPYGYRKIYPEPKVHTLEPVPEEAETVRQIFAMYLDGMGAKAIAARLNLLQIPPQKSAAWESVSVRKILRNPIYAGKVQWHTKRDGVILAAGRHPALVSEADFEKVQRRFQDNPAAGIPQNHTMQNYYHNLLFCGNCGHQMRRRPAKSGSGYLLCLCAQCRGKIRSAPIDYVDRALLAAVRFRLDSLKAKKSDREAEEAARHSEIERKRQTLQTALEKLQRQKNKLYTLLETEVYSVETYLERSKALAQQQAALESELQQLHEIPAALPPDKASVWLQYILDHFPTANATEKNQMLLQAIRRIDYFKTTGMCMNKKDSDLKLEIDFR